MASPEEMRESMIANLKPNTGKTLAQWLKLTKASKLEKHGQIIKLLKEEHGMTHGYANLVAWFQLNPGGAKPAAGDLVASQYAGKKSALQPIYEALVKLVNGLGRDLELAPKKAYVSLRRSKQFGLIQPSTATRVDLGLNLKGEPPTERLEASGSFNSMCSHRVRLSSVKDVDAQLKAWIKKAYSKA